ncbi:MAG: SMP-30/gluconolactonase/LRE family protein [Rhodopila sp.]|nr:SMP-30/gluconolactonase/LRE family protein [Rhodopila sp.]
MAGKAQSGVTPVGDTRDILGEVPIWSVVEQALWWIDVRGPFLRRRDWASGALQSWKVPELVGCIAQCAGRPGLIVGLRSAVGFFDPATGAWERFPAPHADAPQMRFNDGKCDRQGRFWVGSMDDVGRRPIGTLYRFEAGHYTPVLDGIVVPNSLCWSPDGATMYFADGIDPVIWSFPFDTATGNLGERRQFVRLADGTGIPDGTTVDAEGYLWNAQYGGSVVTRYAPDGRVDRVIPVPVTQPTSCAFAGADLSTLVITTAAQRLTPEALARQPLAGALFALPTNVRGLPESQYAA